MTISWVPPQEVEKPTKVKHDQSTVDLLVDRLIQQDDGRARTQQTMLGPSAVYGCQQAAFYRLTGKPATNTPLRFSSIMGTAIHEAVEAAFEGASGVETEITVPGIPELIADGHIDAYFPKREHITDWKTSKLVSQAYFPKDSQIAQTQIYGYLAQKSGRPVKTVELVSIPRDGTEKNIVNHIEEYSETKALEALGWFEEVRDAVELGIVPDCTCTKNFCRNYCDYWEA